MDKISKNNKSVKEEKNYKIIVYRSNLAIYAQAIDLSNNNTVVSASSAKFEKKEKPQERAKKVGLELAKKLKDIKAKYHFDRNGLLYHGQVKALADGLREGGIKI